MLRAPRIRVKEDIYRRARAAMVDGLVKKGIGSKPLLDAMSKVPRHLFVEEAFYSKAYGDHALPIGEKQTISQPLTVALMIEALGLKGTEKVLEVGAGSGYVSALLSLLAEKVFALERLPALAQRARRILDHISSSNVVLRVGDGSLGLPEEAPYDAIIVSASSPDIPRPYVEQLKTGGRLVMPVGEVDSQVIVRLVKTGSGATRKVVSGCRFVKLVGKNGWKCSD